MREAWRGRVGSLSVCVWPCATVFAYGHLPPLLQEVSKPFGELAQQIEETLPSNPEKTMALHKLLEAKDCTLRALLFKTEGQPQKEAA
jgi:hypothetical protein